MKIVLLSHTAIDSVFTVGSHHYARQLARLGHQVIHVSTPYSPIHSVTGRRTDGRREAAGRSPFEDNAGVLQVVPTLPLPLTLANQRRALAVEMRPFDQPDLLLVDQPLFASAIEPLAAKRIIYRPTDVYVRRRYRKRQAVVLRQADGVIATSGVVLAELGDLKVPTAVISNGVDTEHFSGVKIDQLPARQGAVYVGSLDDRFSWDILHEFASAWRREYPDEPVDVFGPRPRKPVRPLGGVQIRGPVNYTLLPATLAAYRVGVMPFTESLVNQGRSPMKLYEYLASGLTVWAPPYMAQAGLDARAGVVYSDGADLEPLWEALKEPIDARSSAVLVEQGWESKTQELLDFANRLDASNP